MKGLHTQNGEEIFLLHPENVNCVMRDPAAGIGSYVTFLHGVGVFLKEEPIEIMDFLFPPLEIIDSEEDLRKPSVLHKTEEEEYILEQARMAYEMKFGIPLRSDENIPEDWLEMIREKRALSEG